MRVTLVIKLLDKYSLCPKCGKTIMTDSLEVDNDICKICCDCGWNLIVNEVTAEELVKEHELKDEYYLEGPADKVRL